MLVLSRLKGQQIVMGSRGEIVVTVTHIDGVSCRIKVECPPAIPVRPGEKEPNDGHGKAQS